MNPYVSIDTETTGLDPAYCQILEVGAVIELPGWQKSVELLPTFHCYVVHERTHGDPYALWLNAEILKRIADRKKIENAQYMFLEPDLVCFALAGFLDTNGINPRKVLAAGKNFGSFDLQFFKRLPDFDRQLTFRHRFIDPSMLYWRPEIDEVPPDSKACMTRAGRSGEVAHTAVADAREVIEMVRASQRPTLESPSESRVKAYEASVNQAPANTPFDQRRTQRSNCIASSPSRN